MKKKPNAYLWWDAAHGEWIILKTIKDVRCCTNNAEYDPKMFGRVVIKKGSFNFIKSRLYAIYVEEVKK